MASKELVVAPTRMALGSTAGLAPAWTSGPDRCSLTSRGGAAVKHAPETIPVPSPSREREQPRRYMEAGGALAPVDDALAASAFDYERFTRLSGPLTRPAAGEPYRVQYRGIHHSRRERVMIRLIALLLAASGSSTGWSSSLTVPTWASGCGRGPCTRPPRTPTSSCWWGWRSDRS